MYIEFYILQCFKTRAMECFFFNFLFEGMKFSRPEYKCVRECIYDIEGKNKEYHYKDILISYLVRICAFSDALCELKRFIFFL